MKFALLVRIAMVSVALFAAFVTGCGKGKKPNDSKESKEMAARQQQIGDLKQLGLMYHNYLSVNKDQPPTSADDFIRFAGNNAQLVQVVQKVKSGQYVLIWRLNTKQLSGSSIVGYEKDVPDVRWHRDDGRCFGPVHDGCGISIGSQGERQMIGGKGVTLLIRRHPMNRSHACRIAVVVLSVLTLSLTSAGCLKKKKAAEAEPTGNPLQPVAGGAPAQGVVRRGAQIQVNKQVFRDIGQYYALYRNENGRPPQNMAEFLAYLKSDPNARTRLPPVLESGSVVMIFNPPPSSNQVLAYEKEMFQLHQNRVVLMGDGSVRTMVEPEFRAALKAQ